MKKNILLLLGVTALTLVMALGLIRQLAPALLGGPADLRLVQLDEKQPAFFKGVFRQTQAGGADDVPGEQILLKDPLTRVRGRPFIGPMLDAVGPHDVLGFRNAAVPVAADIVTIGDSMTYGNNAPLQQNWPNAMLNALQHKDVNVYNMSIGGWAAVQYLDMLDYAQALRPYVVVVAFYTGNDSIESFQMVTANEPWKWLQESAGITPGITLDGLPEFSLDVPPEEQWPVTFGDGVSTVFTPQLRLISNTKHPAVDAGYAIMATTGRLIAEAAKQQDVQLVFTIIPTKELAYAGKVAAEKLDAPDKYRELVTAESARLQTLAAGLQSIDGAHYVDLVKPLQQAALGSKALYPAGINGHPVAEGYRVIGDTVAAAIDGLLPESACGLYALAIDNSFYFILVNDEGAWYFNSKLDIQQNGWPEGEVSMVSQRQLLRLPQRGTVSGIDPQRFGPAACQRPATVD